ncbi:NADH dehydrogenase [Marinitoga sp. 1135]|uniref:NADH:ubiquinone oxidoreductase 27 kD subunit n=1 Tax=Marinitoga piezophila (strain DSM 14283 / JCM 11233 / KA3) TaxID=443254 RepID=H2J5S6_MARPK|nr:MULTISPECIES: NADH-quinone oxidoreductase subunit C [Marinitoga]AEX85062.1 NADH:ubiquinone oxidoreductase 27 kD subunit [Marinitoga piezophila KA3]NUU95278.1 NADH dehydrogenase [Marinitoga sp. 1135]NUU97212.1 NADH dehydrogenase [Marinitoga sp. 1138]
MNSMNNIIEDIKAKFNPEFHEIPKKNQISFDFKSDQIHAVLSYLKSKGWKQLTMLTCVDWIKENKFQLVYLLFNWDEGITIQVRTKIDRDKPNFRTIIDIFPGAEYYERDVHEFFGVTFEGNENANKELFLELWDDIPPMRKDFDPLAYSKKKFDVRDYKVDFIPKEGEAE